MLYAPERILVAPSGFKESLSAIEVADAITMRHPPCSSWLPRRHFPRPRWW